MIGRVLNIIDVSSMLYAGHAAKAYSPKSDTCQVGNTTSGIPIGGIRYVLRTVLQKMKMGEHVLLVFDSPTDKKQFYSDYKSNRCKDPSIYVQQLMMLDAAKRIQIPYLKVDTYEADDLINAAVLRYEHEFVYVRILSGDADLAANIHNEYISVVGVASIYPTIIASNFETTVKKNCIIPFNSILPYFAIYGKPSNNVKAVAEAKVCKALYEHFITFSKNSSDIPGYWSTLNHFCKWLQDELNNYPDEEEVITALLDRTPYIFPKVYEPELNLKFHTLDGLDESQVKFFLKTFNLDSILQEFGYYDFVAAAKTSAMLEYLAEYKRDYETGVLAVDADMSADDSIFSRPGDTDFFVNEGDF